MLVPCRATDGSIHKPPRRVFFFPFQFCVPFRKTSRLHGPLIGEAVDAHDAAFRRAHQPPFGRARDRIAINLPQVAAHAEIAIILQQLLKAHWVTLHGSWRVLVVILDGETKLLTDE